MGCVSSTPTSTSRDLSSSTDQLKRNLFSRAAVIPYKNENFSAVCARVIDGDTIVIKFHEGNNTSNRIIQENVRLAHINAAEIHTKSIEEKEQGILAKNYLFSLVSGEMLRIYCLKRDKYGRLLCEIYNEKNIYVNQAMIDAKHAVPYEGGAR